MPCILEGDDDEDDADKQRKLFPEPEEVTGRDVAAIKERLTKAADGIRNAVPGAEVTISSGGRSVKLKSNARPMPLVKKGAAAKKKKKAK
jgi:hypothetical protein